MSSTAEEEEDEASSSSSGTLTPNEDPSANQEDALEAFRRQWRTEVHQQELLDDQQRVEGAAAACVGQTVGALDQAEAEAVAHQAREEQRVFDQVSNENRSFINKYYTIVPMSLRHLFIAPCSATSFRQKSCFLKELS